MARDAVEKVKKAEEEARLIIEEAKHKYDSIVKIAREEAETQYRQLISNARAEAASLKEKTINEAHEQARKIIEAATAEAEKIRNIDVTPAVNNIVDRIVKANVNS